MNITPTQREILGLERKYWQAMKESDVETAVELTHFPCIVASPKGAMRVSESQYRKMMESNNAAQFKDIEIENPQVDVISNDTAMITYEIQFNGMKMLDVSTWIKDDGKWTCAFHSENPEGEPEGEKDAKY